MMFQHRVGMQRKSKDMLSFQRGSQGIIVGRQYKCKTLESFLVQTVGRKRIIEAESRKTQAESEEKTKHEIHVSFWGTETTRYLGECTETSYLHFCLQLRFCLYLFRRIQERIFQTLFDDWWRKKRNTCKYKGDVKGAATLLVSCRHWTYVFFSLTFFFFFFDCRWCHGCFQKFTKET